MVNNTTSDLIAGRRIVSVMFADICGFTTLSENLDPEEVFELINHIFEVLSDEIEKQAGRVDK